MLRMVYAAEGSRRIPSAIRFLIVLSIVFDGKSARQAAESEQFTYGDTTVTFDRRTADRIVGHFYMYGDVKKPRKFYKGRSDTMPLPIQLLLVSYVQGNNCSLYLQEMQKKLRDAGFGLWRISTIANALHRQGYSHKVLVEIAIQRDAVERARFFRQLRAIPVEKLVFIDEVHKNDADCRRLKGWALRGMKARVKAAFGRGTGYSVFAACNVNGFLTDACYSIRERGVTAEDFMQWAQVWLLPHLEPGSVVVADNCSIHHKYDLAALLATKHCSVLWLPPYSPGELNF